MGHKKIKVITNTVMIKTKNNILITEREIYKNCNEF